MGKIKQKEFDGEEAIRKVYLDREDKEEDASMIRTPQWNGRSEGEFVMVSPIKSFRKHEEGFVMVTPPQGNSNDSFFMASPQKNICKPEYGSMNNGKVRSERERSSSSPISIMKRSSSNVCLCEKCEMRILYTSPISDM